MMSKYFSTFVIGFAFLGLTSPATANRLIGDLSWGDDHQQVLVALEKLCNEIRVVEVKSPTFPLARKKEQHLVCYGLALPRGHIDGAAFVIADDKLSLIEARGGAVAAIAESRADKPSHYLDRKVFDGGELIVDEGNDTIWLSSKEALPLNLFTWSNPYLATTPSYNLSAATPDFLVFGEKFEKLKPLFVQACPMVNVETIEKPWLPNTPATQLQLNCVGYEYAGFPRRIEAVFGDGILEVVWILTGKNEEDRVRTALVEAFGAAKVIAADWEVFEGQRVALRKDKPEVLMISEKMVPYYTKQLTGNLPD